MNHPFKQVLLDAIRIHGGAYTAKGRSEPWVFVVAAGPLCGTYHFDRVPRYSPRLYSFSRIFTVKQLARLTKSLQPFQDWLTRHSDVFGSRIGRGWSLLMNVYILSQVAGWSLERLLSELDKEPRRVLSRVSFPQRLKDRQLYARTFFKNWSAQEAQKATYPKVPGIGAVPPYYVVPHLFHILVPSWKQKVKDLPLSHFFDLESLEAERDGMVHDGVSLDHPDMRSVLAKLEGGMEVRIHELCRFATTQHSFKILGIERDEFKGMVYTWPFQQLHRLRDTLWTARRAKGQLVESLEGRRVLQAVERRDWKAVLRAHDFVTQFRQVVSLASVARCEAFHVQARSFVCPPGVTPLCTQEEFRREGEEMGHCVGGYFWQRKNWCFAFLASDGTRATMELHRSPSGSLSAVQFHGPENSTASTQCFRLRRKFLVANRHEERGWASRSGRAKKVDEMSSVSM